MTRKKRRAKPFAGRSTHLGSGHVTKKVFANTKQEAIDVAASKSFLPIKCKLMKRNAVRGLNFYVVLGTNR